MSFCEIADWCEKGLTDDINGGIIDIRRGMNEVSQGKRKSRRRTMTEDQKQEALNRAIRAHDSRIDAAKNIRPNSFEAWGNDKCISRASDTIEAMERGTASERQYKYWLKH